jgi:hypothetical protein
MMAAKHQGSKRMHPIKATKPMPGSAAPKTSTKTPSRKPPRNPPMRGHKA